MFDFAYMTFQFENSHQVTHADICIAAQLLNNIYIYILVHFFRHICVGCQKVNKIQINCNTEEKKLNLSHCHDKRIQK